MFLAQLAAWKRENNVGHAWIDFDGDGRRIVLTTARSWLAWLAISLCLRYDTAPDTGRRRGLCLHLGDCMVTVRSSSVQVVKLARLGCG